MFRALLSGVALLCCAGTAQAQVMLSTYANKDGYIDVQKLTCGTVGEYLSRGCRLPDGMV